MHRWVFRAARAIALPLRLTPPLIRRILYVLEYPLFASRIGNEWGSSPLQDCTTDPLNTLGKPVFHCWQTYTQKVMDSHSHPTTGLGCCVPFGRVGASSTQAWSVAKQ